MIRTFPKAILSLLLVVALPVFAAKLVPQPKVFRINLSTEIDGSVADGLDRAFEVAKLIKPDAIMLVINSPGGEVGAGWRMVTAIRNSPIPVHCVVDGMAASMAFILLQSCTTRTMTPESILLAHQPYTYVDAPMHINELRTLLNALQAMSDMAEVMCANRMGISQQEFHEQTSSVDWWMSSISGMKWHAVDGVVKSVDAAKLSIQAIGSPY